MTDENKQRYARHILLKEVGEAGQEKLASARVLVIGAGGLGSPVALYLAAAGVGHIGIADADAVELSNLQRQIIHTTADLGRMKVESAKNKMVAQNPNVDVETWALRLTDENIDDVVSRYDFVIDATDNFTTKFLINDCCVRLGKPFSHGSVMRFSGHTMTWVPGAATYRDVFPEPPVDGSEVNCGIVGLLGTMPGIIGTIQATEALKYLLGVGELLTNKLLVVDALDASVTILPVAKS